jgi:RNA polymerase sigma-70 factor, ECF subfamily
MATRRPLITDKDLALLRAASAGHGDAFGELFVRYRRAVLAYCVRLTREPETAADLMAETFAGALLAVARGQAAAVDEPAAWLMRIARNKFIDAGRRGMIDAAARQELAFAPQVLDDRDLARISELGADDALLRALPRDLSDAVRARVIDELTYPEIAQSLGCSELVVRKRVSRGLKRLRQELKAANP